MDPDLLTTARACRIEDLTNDLRVYGRRAKTPEDRVALAELERELLGIRQRWLDAGLIQEVTAAAA